MTGCLGIRIAAPTEEEVAQILQYTAKKESVRLPDELALSIAKESHRNLRRAILMLEACRVQSPNLAADTPVQRCDWETYITATAHRILTEQSPNRLMEVRGRLYELLTHCIPPNVVLKNLTFELIKTLDTTLKVEVIREASEYEHRMQLGSRAIFHLEAFVAKFMSTYKRYLMEMSGML